MNVKWKVVSYFVVFTLIFSPIFSVQTTPVYSSLGEFEKYLRCNGGVSPFIQEDVSNPARQLGLGDNMEVQSKRRLSASQIALIRQNSRKEKMPLFDVTRKEYEGWYTADAETAQFHVLDPKAIEAHLEVKAPGNKGKYYRDLQREEGGKWKGVWAGTEPRENTDSSARRKFTIYEKPALTDVIDDQARQSFEESLKLKANLLVKEYESLESAHTEEESKRIAQAQQRAREAGIPSEEKSQNFHAAEKFIEGIKQCSGFEDRLPIQLPGESGASTLQYAVLRTKQELLAKLELERRRDKEAVVRERAKSRGTATPGDSNSDRAY